MKIIGRVLAWPLLGLVWIYRNAISPLVGANCRFQPTCSKYAEEALRKHGAFKGGWLAIKRIGRCHPWNDGGYDPVPRPPAEDRPRISELAPTEDAHS